MLGKKRRRERSTGLGRDEGPFGPSGQVGYAPDPGMRADGGVGRASFLQDETGKEEPGTTSLALHYTVNVRNRTGGPPVPPDHTAHKTPTENKVESENRFSQGEPRN